MPDWFSRSTEKYNHFFFQSQLANWISNSITIKNHNVQGRQQQPVHRQCASAWQPNQDGNFVRQACLIGFPGVQKSAICFKLDWRSAIKHIDCLSTYDGLLARRDIADNKFSGTIEALGKLKKIGALYDTLLSCRRGWIHGNARTFYLCLRRSIQKNQFEGSVKALENLVALTQLCVGVNCVSVMRGI